MTKRELIEKCTHARKCLKEISAQGLIPLRNDSDGYGFPNGWCMITSIALGLWLSQFDSQNDFMLVTSGFLKKSCCRSHAWLEYKNYAIDITADQFKDANVNVEEIMVINIAEYYKTFSRSQQSRPRPLSSSDLIYPAETIIYEYLKSH